MPGKGLMAGMVVVAFAALTLMFADAANVDGHYGSWVTFSVTDPMTDITWYGAGVRSPAGDQIQVDTRIWCEPDKLGVTFLAKEFLGSGYRDVE